MMSTDHFIKQSPNLMVVDCSVGEKRYGVFTIPEAAKKIFEKHEIGYRIKCDHDSPSLWMGYCGDLNDPLVKKLFNEQCEKGLVEWSDPNIQCKHCGKYFDPSYDFIEDEEILTFCSDKDGSYKYPHYCPYCIEELFEFCSNAEQAFAERDIIKS